MRRRFTIVFIVCCLACLQAGAQNYSLKCFQVARYEGNYNSSVQWTDTAMPVEVKFIDKQILLGKHPQELYAITRFEPITTDTAGSTMHFEALDPGKNSCKIELTQYRRESYHMASLFIKHGTAVTCLRLAEPGTKPEK